MDFVENVEMTYVVGGGEGGFMLFESLRRIACKNRYVTHPLYLSTFETIEEMETVNYD